MKISECYGLARRGDLFLLSVQGYWAKGETVKECKKSIRSLGGKVTGWFHLRSVHPDTTIDDLCIRYPQEHAPITIDSSEHVIRKRITKKRIAAALGRSK